MSFTKVRNTVVKFVVLAVAGGLVAALALPANAFDNRPADAAIGSLVTHVNDAPMTQTMSVSPAIELSVSRDGYTATKPVPKVAVAVNRFVTLNPPAQVYSGQAIVDFARQFVGVVPYGMGSSPTSSFSCDGLTQYVFANFGISLPRTADAQAGSFIAISSADALPGDIVWWPGQHIGIYAGGGMMIDSPTWGRYVEFHGIWGNPVYMRLV